MTGVAALRGSATGPDAGYSSVLAETRMVARPR